MLLCPHSEVAQPAWRAHRLGGRRGPEQELAGPRDMPRRLRRRERRLEHSAVAAKNLPGRAAIQQSCSAAVKVVRWRRGASRGLSRPCRARRGLTASGRRWPPLPAPIHPPSPRGRCDALHAHSQRPPQRWCALSPRPRRGWVRPSRLAAQPRCGSHSHTLRSSLKSPPAQAATVFTIREAGGGLGAGGPWRTRTRRALAARPNASLQYNPPPSRTKT